MLTYRPIPFLASGVNAARYFADSTRYGADVQVESPWAVVRGEYVAQHRDVGGGDDDDRGWYLLAAAPLKPWLQPLAKYERFERSTPSSVPIRAWTVGANIRPWGRSTRITLEYVARTTGEPGVRRGLGLAQVQVLF